MQICTTLRFLPVNPEKIIFLAGSTFSFYLFYAICEIFMTIGTVLERGRDRGVPNPGFPEKISAIPSVPIVQNNAFPTSRLKMIIPDSPFPSGKELCSRNPGSFFREKCLIPEFPEFPEPPIPPPFERCRILLDFHTFPLKTKSVIFSLCIMQLTPKFHSSQILMTGTYPEV